MTCVDPRRTAILPGRVLDLGKDMSLFPRSSSGQDLEIRLSSCTSLQQRSRMLTRTATIFVISFYIEWYPGSHQATHSIPLHSPFFLSLRRSNSKYTYLPEVINKLNLDHACALGSLFDMRFTTRMVDLRTVDCPNVECPRIILQKFYTSSLSAPKLILESTFTYSIDPCLHLQGYQIILGIRIRKSA